MSYQKHIHYDKDLEDAVIGACLMEPDAISRLTGMIEPKHFHYEDNQALFEKMMQMWNSGQRIDLISVVHECHKAGLQDKFTAGNIAYLITLKTNAVTSTANLEQHALYIREMYAKRESIRIQSEALKDGGGIDRMLEMQDEIQKILTVNATDDWHDMSEVMIALHNHREEVKGKDMLGIPTGFRQLDEVTYGYQPGQLVIIGARPSVGKSAYTSGTAITAAQHGSTIGIINLEMPEEQIGARLASFYSDMEFWRIYRNKHENEAQEQQLSAFMSDMSSLPIFVSDKTNVTVADIRAKAYKLKKRQKLNMLIIDYLQLIEANTKNKNATREREVAEMSRGLKLLAMDLKIPVILLCQLNRESEKNHNKRPRMSNLRESGAIEQDADIVMLLHRDWKSGIEDDGHGNSTEREADIIIEKNRNGKCEAIKVGFDPDTMKFYDSGERREFLQPVGYRDYSEAQEPF